MSKLLLTIFLFLPVFIFAQDDAEEKQKKFSIGMVPQYAIINGTRIDLDFRLNNNGHWLIAAPQFYVKNNESYNWNWNYKEMIGAGIEIQHKIFFKNRPQPQGTYFSYGPVFQYFSVKEDGKDSYNFNEGGSQYIGLQDQITTTNITKFGGNLMFGLQMNLMDNFYVDAYLGTGFRLSYDSRSDGLHKKYNEWWADMGYSGTLLVAGLRFGLMF